MNQILEDPILPLILIIVGLATARRTDEAVKSII